MKHGSKKIWYTLRAIRLRHWWFCCVLCLLLTCVVSARFTSSFIVSSIRLSLGCFGGEMEERILIVLKLLETNSLRMSWHWFYCTRNEEMPIQPWTQHRYSSTMADSKVWRYFHAASNFVVLSECKESAFFSNLSRRARWVGGWRAFEAIILSLPIKAVLRMSYVRTCGLVMIMKQSSVRKGHGTNFLNELSSY